MPLAGKTFIAAWRNRSAADLYNTIRTSMPYGNPGSLDAATYANLTAFILPMARHRVSTALRRRQR